MPPFVENGYTAFAAALEMGCGIECDLRLTADDRAIVFHDADAFRLTGDPAVIGRSTLAQLSQLRIGDHPIPTLASLLHLVGGRVPLLLEAKVDGDMWRFVPAIVEALAGYRGAVGVMSFNPGFLRKLATAAPAIRRGLVVAHRLSRFRRWVAMKLADPHFLAVETAALGKPWVGQARQTMPVYCWTVKNADQRRLLRPLADALIWETDGRP